MTGPRSRPLMQQDLALAALLALAGVTSVALDLPVVVRLLLTVPLAVLLPGYGLLSALLPSSSLAAVERTIIALGASIGVTVVGGIVLALSPVRLGPLSWSVMLARSASPRLRPRGCDEREPASADRASAGPPCRWVARC
jgi:uncharacterized membrane protein